MNFIAKTFQYRNKEIAWQKENNILAPKKGSIAPNFKLYDVSGKHCVHLSDFLGKKPVALIFGSFT